jgi:hypothetical protein
MNESIMCYSLFNSQLPPSSFDVLKNRLTEQLNMYAQYQSYQQQQQSANTYSSSQTKSWNSNTIPPRNKVEHFTNCYHGWKAHGEQCEQQLPMIHASNVQGRQEVQQQIDWAKYYADLSSRAAHHFYQNPNATSAPYDLPPEPPKTTIQPLVAVNHQPRHQSQQQQQQPQPTKNEDARTPGTLAAYVRTCLDQCPTQEQRKQVQAQIEAKIADAIQKGNLHSKNWANEPLIPVPGAAVLAQHFASFQLKGPKNNQPARYVNKFPHNDSYYGHTAGSAAPASSTAAASSYYGPSTSSHYSANPASSYFQKDGATSSYLSSPQNKRYRTGAPGDNDDFVPLQQKSKKFKKQQHIMKSFKTSSKALAKRANRFSGPGGIFDVSNAAAMTSIDDHDKYMGKRLIGGSSAVLDEEDFERMTVKGTCTTLEKEYLRLTAPPRPELVRPQNILEQHLESLKKYYSRPNRKEYLWFCSQLKAIRLDCTVQRLLNEFTVDVYETHARIALREGTHESINTQYHLLEIKIQFCFFPRMGR